MRVVRLRDPQPPEPATLAVQALLVASEGRPIPDAAVTLAVDIARSNNARVYVFSIARVWGTGLGLPMPGLLPTKAEWDVQNESVRKAVMALRKRGVKAEGRVVGTRRSGKRIVAEAARLGCGAIVMGADKQRNRLVGDFSWSQEPYRVRRRARVPVYLVTQ
jgi:nucleotide-binding universal stress UspA family protein